MGEEEFEPVFYGSGTVGKKGQIVLPAELRKDLDIESGDNLYPWFSNSLIIQLS